VIIALNKRDNHIPYRNSKLTQLLKPFMGSQAKVLMIVNITGLEEHQQESLTSLNFAQKANQTRVTEEEHKENFNATWSVPPSKQAPQNYT
jgi:hypothetical protein